jgi:cytochrome c553
MLRTIKIWAAALVCATLAPAALAAGDAAAGEAMAKQLCAACHGADGNSAAPNFPSLAGQVPGYVADQLARFKSGERANDMMAGIAKPLTPEQMADLDAYFAVQEAKPGAVSEEDLESAERGGRLYRGGYERMEVAACISCHGPSGHGVPRRYPRVAGQKRDYLEQQLLAFKSGKRSSYGDIMTSIAFRMSEQQIKDVSAYMHALQ